MSEHPQHDFVDELMEKIQGQHIRMHSKTYFVTRTILYIGIVVLAALLTVFLLSLLFYYLRASGAAYLIRLGPGGIRDFFSALPISIFLGGIIGVGLVILLAMRFRMTFKKPLLFTLGSIFVGIILGSVFISYLPLHTTLFNAVREGRTPPFAGALHQQLFQRGLAHTVVGEVVVVEQDRLVLEDRFAKEITVYLTDATQYRSNQDLVGEETVLIRIHKDDDILYADVIEVIEGDIEDFHRPGSRFLPRLPVRNVEPAV